MINFFENANLIQKVLGFQQNLHDCQWIYYKEGLPNTIRLKDNNLFTVDHS